MRFNPAIMAAAVRRRRRMNVLNSDLSPQTLVSNLNALANLDPNGGATGRIGWKWGMGSSFQNIAVNGAAPGGYGYTNHIENFINPGDDNYLRPNGLNSGNGAPTTATGRIEGSGLYLPNTASAMASFVGHQDPSVGVGLHDQVPNSLLQDATAGYTVVMLHHYAKSRKYFSFKKSDGSNEHAYSDITLHRSMRDPTVGLGVPATTNGAKSKVLLSLSHVIHTNAATAGITGGNLRFDIQEGSMLNDGGSNGTANYLATDKDFHVLADGGLSADGSSGNLGIYFILLLSGRLNKYQLAYLRAWAKLINYDGNSFWVNPYRLIFMGGDSMEAPFAAFYTDREANVFSHWDHITQGYLGRPSIPNVEMLGFPRSGFSPAEFLTAFFRIFGTLDFVDRPAVWALVWEYVNGGNYTNDVAMNAQVKAYDAKIKTASYETWLLPNNSKNWTTEEAQRLADGWDLAFAEERMQLWDTAFWRNGQVNDPTGGPVQEIFDLSRHLQTPIYEHLETFHYILTKLCLGLDVSADTLEVISSPPTMHLTDVAPTGSFGWTPSGYHGAAVTDTIATYESTNSSIATVDPVTGLVTGVSVGECGIRPITSRGAMGMGVVFVDSVPIIVPDTTTGLLIDLTFELDTLADSSGNGKDFSGVNAPTFENTVGAAGTRSVRLATTSCIRRAIETALQFCRAGRDGFTICVAVEPRDFSGIPFYMECTGAFDVLDTTGTGSLLARAYASGGGTIGSVTKSAAMTINVMNFLAIKVDKPNNQFVMVANANTQIATMAGTPNAAPTGNLNFGAQGTPTPANFLKNGSFARIKIFDIPKNANDINGVKTEFGL